MEMSRRELMRAVFGSAPAMKLRQLLEDGHPPSPELRRFRIQVPGLDRRLDGMRIGHLSDVHIGGMTLGPAYLEQSLRVFGRSAPELLMVTGDLLDDPRATRACMDMLAARRAPYGAFYSLGNHENFQDRDHIISETRRHGGVRLLLNEEAFVRVGDATVHVGGVDYPVTQGAVAKRTAINEQNAQAATAHAADADYRIALSHHPDEWDDLWARGADLTLSGHTHGGQIAPVGPALNSAWYKYVYGFYQQSGRHLYVSGGTGHSLPYRVGIAAEVTEFTLVRTTA